MTDRDKMNILTNREAPLRALAVIECVSKALWEAMIERKDMWTEMIENPDGYYIQIRTASKGQG